MTSQNKRSSHTGTHTRARTNTYLGYDLTKEDLWPWIGPDEPREISYFV